MRSRVWRTLRALFAGVVLSGSILGTSPAVVMAASPTVSAPKATVAFLTSISFSGTATLTNTVSRVELVLDIEGSTRSVIAEVPTGSLSGGQQLAYTFETPAGSLLPNTDVTARFRLALGDGSTLTGAPITVHYNDTRFQWQTLRGEFVTVHWVEGGAAFGRKAGKIADDAVRSVSELLGVTERDPIDFFVYADKTAFYDVIGPGARENVGGEAHPDIRTLFANIGASAVNDPWVSIVIPHELTHLVFDTAVSNPYHYPPRWLNEGIAVYLSESYGADDRAAVRAAAAADSIMPLRALADQFPTSRDRFFLAYSESVAAVAYLVDRYDRDAMVSLVQSYAGGVSDDEAFQAALGVDVAGFETAWLETLGVSLPQPYGPRQAPAGPLPSDWAGAPAAPGSAPDELPLRTPAPNSGQPLVQRSNLPDLTTLALVVAIVVAAVSLGIRARRGSAGVLATEVADNDDLLFGPDGDDDPESSDAASSGPADSGQGGKP
ncbi:MAG: peptidase MA family metallohydrolase [Chloroflexota bacterium]